MPDVWIDTHCHLDAPVFDPDRCAMRARAHAAGVRSCLMVATDIGNFAEVARWAHQFGDGYGLGIHPMCVAAADDDDLSQLDGALTRAASDPHLVAVGEIGLDYFLPELAASGPLRERQEWFYREQLKIARRHGLPVSLHVRRSVDAVLKGLRDVGAAGGIAHAFNGSYQQASQFLDLGFKLGFGGAMTFERATRLRALAVKLPVDAIVMETDSPDIPPQWLYRNAQDRANGLPQARNEPAQVARIGQVLAGLRGVASDEWAQQTTDNAQAVLPRLVKLMEAPITTPQTGQLDGARSS